MPKNKKKINLNYNNNYFKIIKRKKIGKNYYFITNEK